MCTLTAVRIQRADLGSVLRVSFNRDELYTRKRAYPPSEKSENEIRFIHPVDADRQGTWISVNECGILLCLLNVNSGFPAEHKQRSRGEIVLDMRAAGSIEEIRKRIDDISLSDFAPFRLVWFDAEITGTLRWDGFEKISEQRGLDKPVFFTSYGPGDALAAERMELFEEYFNGFDGSEKWIEVQDRFHCYSSLHPEASILMKRDDAETVSRSVIEVSSGEITFQYSEPPWNDESGEKEISIKRNLKQCAADES